MNLCYFVFPLIVSAASGVEISLEFQWSYINFTWESPRQYEDAIANGNFIPEYNVIAGIKIYKDNLYFALPRVRKGTPVTLAKIPIKESSHTNSLLRPYPSWELNVNGNDCSTLQNVQSMEIDTAGIMWVIDGVRFNDNTHCPAKLVLLDLNDNGNIVRTYNFPEHLALSDGGFLNDIVIDQTDGGYAYITDTSSVDPGLIVYSLQKNKAWKLRDSTMFAEIEAAGYVVEGLPMKNLYPIDGIALSPVPRTANEERFVYYSSLVGDKLYSISTKILKDEEVCKGDAWRREVQFVRSKESSGDGMIMDNTGVLYYTLLPLYGVGKWGSRGLCSNSEVAVRDNSIEWADSFSFDNNGNLYLLADNMNKFLNTSYPLELSSKIMFRIFKAYTGTKSYLY